MDLKEKSQHNPMVQNKIEATIELLNDYIASEPLGQAIIQFQKRHPQLNESSQSTKSPNIWHLICRKASQKIMEEIYCQIGNDLSKLDDQIVDAAINKVLGTANQKIKKDQHDAIFFAVTNRPLPPNHPLSSSSSGNLERFNLFGENEIYPEPA